MNWKELLNQEITYTYKIAEELLDVIDDDGLDWKPATGANWMTTGQLALHITSACGATIKGFVTGMGDARGRRSRRSSPGRHAAFG